jgi:monovalent cation:H+ antiporter-2, CPA2 family
MSAELHLLLNVTMAVVIALIGGVLALRLRQPVIVGYLVAGVVIGPFTPGFNGDQHQIAALAEIGVIFLMFALGIEFSLKELARVKGVALGGTTIQVLLTIAAGIALGRLVGWPSGQSIFFGGIIAISSTMVLLKTLLDRGEGTSAHGRVLLGMLVVQDLAAVLLIVLLPQLTSEEGIQADTLALTLAKALGFIGATVLLGTFVVPRFMARVEHLHSAELFLLTAVVLAIGTATASALLGLSPALGAFLGGLMLSETEFDHRVIAEVVPMRNLFSTLFFVSVGMLIDPRFIAQNLPAVLGLALFIAAAKVLATFVAVLPFRLGGKTTTYTALGMLQIGEFSYVLAQTGRQHNALTNTLYSLILASSLVTILLTPWAFRVAPAVERLVRRLPFVGSLLAEQRTSVGEVAAYQQHAILAGYGRVGRQIATGLRDLGLPIVVIEEDLRLVQQLVREGIPALYGDASQSSTLASTHPEAARLVVLALPETGATRAAARIVRRANPTVPIVARLEREDDADSLLAAGVTVAIGPEQAGARLILEESARALELPLAAPLAVSHARAGAVNVAEVPAT